MAKKKRSSPALSKITARAKQIRRSSPRTKWTAAIKQAGADYRAGRLGAIKLIERGETKKTPVKKTYRVNRTKKGLFKGTSRVGSISRISAVATTRKPAPQSPWPGYVSGVGQSIAGLKSTIRQKLEMQLGTAYVLLNKTIGKMKRRKVQKKITAIKSQLRKFL